MSEAQSYSKLPVDEARDGLLEEEAGYTPQREKKPSQRQSWLYSAAIFIPWVLATFFFGTTCVLLWQSQSNSVGTYESSFRTEFRPDSDPIPLTLIQQQFTNTLHYNETSKHLYIQPLNTSSPIYVGKASSKIDAAWHELLEDQQIPISSAEASQLSPEHRSPITTTSFSDTQEPKRWIELSAFHALSCLNTLRQSTYLDHAYYTSNVFTGNYVNMGGKPGGRSWSEQEAGRALVDYCIDLLRQEILCHGDLTPVPLVEVKGEGLPVGTFIAEGEGRTCRDFEMVRDWARERGKTGV